MADDKYSRGYRNDPHDRGGAGGSGSAPDPLTELARLIGQSDPFGDPKRQQADTHRHGQPAEWPYDTPHDDRHGAARESQHPADDPDAYAAYRNGYAYPQAGQHDAGYGDTSGYGEQQPYHQEQQHDPAYDHEQHAYAQDQGDPAYFAQASAGGRADQAHQSAALHPDQHGGYPAPPFGDPNARPDEYYEDAPAPRRGWVVTAAALVGLAVIGTAGAFAYRAVFSGSGETRIITRDVGPSKITPAQTTQDSTSKPSDRLASAGQNERLGPAPEQPIAIPEPPRTVPPALTQRPPAVAAPVLPAAPSLATPAEPAGPPARMVRTERIKPLDQVGDAAPTKPAGPTRPGASPPVQPPQPRVATQTPPPAANAPLSLAPQPPSTPAPAPAPAPPSQTTAAASPAPAVERNGGGANGWYVQVSAQKSEDEAKSSYRGIQARHASLLGSHQLVVRRKDLGSKGVFYGAQVGPFASREAAIKLCEDLKAAGQSCMSEKH